VVACAAGGAVFVWRGKIFKKGDTEAQAATNSSTKVAAKAPRVIHPIPTNTCWTMTLSNAVIPDTDPVGNIHGNGFLCERTTLQGGRLDLRQGRGWPPDLGVTLLLTARQGEELSGRTVEIGPDRAPPLPKLTVRWKDDQDKAVNQNITEGYALKVVFGQAVNSRIAGRIYLALPDDAKSFIAGTFDAEIRKPAPPKPPKAKGPPGGTGGKVAGQ
jgi:hypothetical protein